MFGFVSIKNYAFCKSRRCISEWETQFYCAVFKRCFTIDGELSLQAGDVHFLEDNMANYLVSTGVAEIAEL